MNENKKARSDAVTSEQAKDSSTVRSYKQNKNNIDRRKVQAFLLEGEANALPMRELARLTGISERQVRKLIERERGAGGLILSSDKGYFLPSPDNASAEMRDYIRRVDSRMHSNRIAVKRLKRALKELEAQDGGQSKLNI